MSSNNPPSERRWDLPPPTTLYTNAVYFPNYRVYENCFPRNLNLGVISHIFYAFGGLSPEGRVFLTDTWADSQIDINGVQGCLNALVAEKSDPNHKHLKVILSIGGGQGSQNFATVAADHDLRHTFATSVKSFLDHHGLDGVDIDWEHPLGEEEGRNYIYLLTALRAALPRTQYILSTSLAAAEWALQNINLEELFSLANFVNLMAYDYFGKWSAEGGHHAALYGATPNHPSAHAAITYIFSRSAIDPSKILLGVPCYGRAFSQTQPGAPSFFDDHPEVQDGAVAVKHLPLDGTVEDVDYDTATAQCVAPDGSWISYDTPDTVRVKARYVEEMRLGGLVFWEATQDRTNYDNSLVAAGFSELMARR